MASETSWRPLGIDSDEEIAEYDALHDGVPEWMYSALWEWVRSEITIVKKDYATKGSVQRLDRRIVEPMLQTLQIRIPDVRNSFHPIHDVIITLQDTSKDLQVVDYILEGTLELTIEDKVLVLEKGDCVYFDATLPHCMNALNGEPAKFLCVVN